MELQFKPIGSVGYAGGMRGYSAEVPLKSLTSTSVSLPLFVMPKGSTVVACKGVFTEASDSAASAALDVGLYKLTSDGTIGVAVDADALFAATAVGGKDAETIASPAATAHGLLLTEDCVVCAAPSAVTTAPKAGVLRVEVFAVR